ncbi:hypothetical protein ACJX0J_038803, partial [Zea mays]
IHVVIVSFLNYFYFLVLVLNELASNLGDILHFRSNKLQILDASEQLKRIWFENIFPRRKENILKVVSEYHFFAQKLFHADLFLVEMCFFLLANNIELLVHVKQEQSISREGYLRSVLSGTLDTIGYEGQPNAGLKGFLS